MSYNGFFNTDGGAAFTGRQTLNNPQISRDHHDNRGQGEEFYISSENIF